MASSKRVPKAVIFGCEGTSLSDAERRFFSAHRPFGFILFARNCASPAQTRALVEELKETVGRERLPVLIDQEGGRVVRLKPPHWRAVPPAGQFAALALRDMAAAREATQMNARLIAHELHALGITVNCAPTADLLVDGAHGIIGDRSYGREPQRVAALARAMAQGLMEGGVVPVVKHIPGHGRASVDSHESLPVVREKLDVLRATDFAPFAALRDLPMAMTAHVLYPAIDPDRMATVSPAVIRLIREDIGFKGLLMSDDISMKAMGGDFAGRTCDALAAGCDIVLHCNGDMAEMKPIAEAAPPMTPEAVARAERAMASVPASPKPFDVASAQVTVEKALMAAA